MTPPPPSEVFQKNIQFGKSGHPLHNFTVGNVSKLFFGIQNMSFLVEWLGSQAKYLDISNDQNMLGVSNRLFGTTLMKLFYHNFL